MMDYHQDFHWMDNGLTEQGMKSAFFEKDSSKGFVTLFVDDMDPVSYQVHSKIKIKIAFASSDEPVDTNSSMTEVQPIESKSSETEVPVPKVEPSEPLTEQGDDHDAEVVEPGVLSGNIGKCNNKSEGHDKANTTNGKPLPSSTLSRASRRLKRACKTTPKVKRKRSKVKAKSTSAQKIIKKLDSGARVKRKVRVKVETLTCENDDSASTELQQKKTMEKKSKLKKQASEHNDDKRKCEFCFEEFDTKFALYEHKKAPNDKTHTCEACFKEFAHLAYLEIHQKLECSKRVSPEDVKSDEHTCEKCGVKARDLYCLKRHNMEHTEEFLYKCCICQKMFVEPKMYNNHMSKHQSGGMIRCRCCDKLFPTRSALSKHQLSLMEIKCHLCGQIFQNRTSRSRHYQIDHVKDILRCSRCSSLFSSQEEFDSHMKRHGLYKKKQCPTCGKFFSRLERHVLTHKSGMDQSELLQCDKCPAKFAHRSSFQRHMSIHSTEKPYQCPECPKAFADCGVLRKHLQMHSPIFPFQCEICGKKCKSSGNMKVHMRIHSDKRPFPCPKCPQAFNYKSSLDSHLKSRHPGPPLTSTLASLIPPLPHTSNSPDQDPALCSTDHMTGQKAEPKLDFSNSTTYAFTINSTRAVFYDRVDQAAAVNLSFPYDDSGRTDNCSLLSGAMLPGDSSVREDGQLEALQLAAEQDRWMQQ